MDAAFASGGELGALMRAKDWSESPLGPPESWPQSLRSAVSILLPSRAQICLFWGPELAAIYNDSYGPVLGQKHPWALGRPAREMWAEIWPDVLQPLLERVRSTGAAFWASDYPFALERHGFPEETYFDISYDPVRDESGGVGGVFCIVSETTGRVIGERRLRTLRAVSRAGDNAETTEQAFEQVARVLAENRHDLPFALLYSCRAEGEQARLAAGFGMAAPPPEAWPLARAAVGREEVVLQGEEIASLGAIVTEPWPEPVRTIVTLPIVGTGQSLLGFLVAGVSPRRPWDHSYRDFLRLVAANAAAVVGTARALAQERSRAQALAELDRAKTAFFANVSHEFRTPLTLMMGPLQDALRDPALSEENRDRLQLAQRNSLRLLKLVNALLDFSRIEAGRIEASYEATDLAALTCDLASTFRSTIERAGLRLALDCPPLGEPVYVDREMWEKIVLNLLSNAFKFTFEGEIEVALHARDENVEFSVRDTGIGIPAEELPRLFERFHRVKGARGRSFEGSGIGLGLVQELARLHGGSVAVESAPGRGTRFTVTIPRGKAHLPAERIEAARSLASTGIASAAYVDEAERWMPAAEVAAIARRAGRGEEPPDGERELVVVADDNADMREYVSELLRGRFRVHAVADGEEAVAAARELRPALILADVMMPRLDGFGVLRAIRSEPQLTGTPVILLSARAGEESRVEGLEAGADDYLVKPFTARELVARVSTHVRMAHLRRETAEGEANLRAEAELERQRLQELLAQAPAAIALLSGPEHRFTYVNEHYLRVTGRKSAGDFLGKTIREALPEVATQIYGDLLDQVYRSGEPYFGREMPASLNRGPSGAPERVYFDFVYQPIRGRKGATEGILVHAVEVTERVQAQKAMDANRARLEVALLQAQKLAAIVESSDDAIVSKDLRGIVQSWNPGAERIFGYTAQEMMGKPITMIIPPELQSDEERILATIARGERIEHFETVRLTKSGERIEVSLTISPVKDDKGRIVGAAKIARDITERKKAEAALRTSERLASVGRLAATVAHEINNPLEAVTNFIYLAKQVAVRNDVKSFLAGAEEELERIAHLTKQTLGFYRETKSRGPVRLGGLISALLPVFASRLRNKGIELAPEIAGDPEIDAVAGEIRQLVTNLVNNSIDATGEDGRIRVRVAAATEWGGRGRRGVRLTVADTGEGISSAAAARLFEPFFTTKRDVGTGLGLWVSKSIVDKHEGSIRMKSSTAPGRHGTVFTVFLPGRAEEISLRQAV